MEKGTQYMLGAAVLLVGFFLVMSFSGTRPQLGLMESSIIVGIVAAAGIGYIVTRKKSSS
jgi:hypothetical protein